MEIIEPNLVSSRLINEITNGVDNLILSGNGEYGSNNNLTSLNDIQNGTSIQTRNEIVSTIGENTTRSMNYTDDDMDDFTISEVFPTDVNPYTIREKKYTMDDYTEALQIQILSDGGRTTGDKYSFGDTRGNPIERYKDLYIVYNYLLGALKNKELKEMFKENYGPVIDKFYSNNIKGDISYEKVKSMFLVPTEYRFRVSCKGKVIDDFNCMIHVYRNVVNGSTTVPINYGYIYKFINEKKRSKEKQKLSITPFYNGTNSMIGGQFSYLNEDRYDHKKNNETQEWIEIKIPNNYKIILDFLKSYMNTYEEEEKKKKLTEIVEFTNSLYVKTEERKLIFNMKNVYNIIIESLMDTE